MYNYITAKEFITSTLIKINDAEGVSVSRDEVLLYLKEGLQIINCLTFFQQERIVTNPTLNITYEDITGLVNIADRVNYDKDISELVNEIKIALLENITSAATTNKEVFDSDSIASIVENKVNEFISATSIVYEIYEKVLPPIPVNLIALPERTIEVSRIGIEELAIEVGDNNTFYVVREEKFKNISAFGQKFIYGIGKPKYYTRSPDSLNITFYPALDTIGTFRALITSNPDFTSLTKLPIPTNLSWIIKYGVLYEFWSQNGNGYDAKRAEYCKTRWTQGIQLGKIYKAILTAKGNSKGLTLTTLKEFDRKFGWESDSGTSINSIALIGWNLLAYNKKLTEVYGLEFEVLANTILPTDESSKLQLKREHLQGLYDYVLHLIELKYGEASFYTGMDKLKKFLDTILNENPNLTLPDGLLGKTI